MLFRSEILKFDPTWERLFFQSQLLLTILVLMHLTRNRRRAFVQARAEAEAENETVSSEALPPDSSTRLLGYGFRGFLQAIDWRFGPQAARPGWPVAGPLRNR